MSADNTPKKTPKTLIEDGLFKSSIPGRKRRNNRWTRIYMMCVGLAAIALVILLVKIIDDAFGYIAIADVVDPLTLVTEDGRLLEEQTKEELAALVRDTTDERDSFYVSTDRLFSVFLSDVAQTDASPADLRDTRFGQHPGQWSSVP